MIEEQFDTAPCGIFAYRDDGTLCGVNATCAALLGWEKADMEGQTVESLFTLPTRIFFQTHFFPLVKLHGHAEEIFVTLLHRHGDHLPVLMNAARVEDVDGACTSCAFIPVPNRKNFEDELVRARNAAEKALAENSELQKAKSELQLQAVNLEQQMQQVNRQNNELRQFSHVVTHNLTEPLRKIVLFAGRLKAEPDPTLLGKLERSAGQMKAVVSGLQQYVWLAEKPNNFQCTEPGEVLHRVATQVDDELGPNLLLLTSEKIPALECDKEQIELLFYHLLQNAIQFRQGDTARVHVSATTLKRNSFQAVEDKYKYEEYLRLEVRDNGTGFDRVYKEHIFELFRRLGGAAGQGLGLALCRKIAENHCGFIEADAQPGEGTTITIWLPLRQSTTQASPKRGL